MTTLDFDSEDLVYRLQRLSSVFSLDTQIDCMGMVGFDVSSDIHVLYSLEDKTSTSNTLRVTLVSKRTSKPLRFLTFSLYKWTISGKYYYDYGTMPFTKGGSFDHDNSVIKVYRAEVVPSDLVEIVSSLPKSHVQAFNKALDSIHLF